MELHLSSTDGSICPSISAFSPRNSCRGKVSSPSPRMSFQFLCNNTSENYHVPLFYSFSWWDTTTDSSEGSEEESSGQTESAWSTSPNVIKKERKFPRNSVYGHFPYDARNLCKTGISKTHQFEYDRPLYEIKPKKNTKRKWARMTTELFMRIVKWEQSQRGIKQSDIEKKFNVNRTTYYRWKQRQVTYVPEYRNID